MSTDAVDQDSSIDEVDVPRIEHDAAYRRELAGRLVARTGVDIDHTGLRPAIRRVFPQLAKHGTEAAASKLVGTIATMLVDGHGGRGREWQEDGRGPERGNDETDDVPAADEDGGQGRRSSVAGSAAPAADEDGRQGRRSSVGGSAGPAPRGRAARAAGDSDSSGVGGASGADAGRAIHAAAGPSPTTAGGDSGAAAVPSTAAGAPAVPRTTRDEGAASGAGLRRSSRRWPVPIGPKRAAATRHASPDFGFPLSYGELTARQKRTLEEFCRQRIERGERDANVVLDRLRDRYGWPYSKQTFCVGPWRMARQRHRHTAELRESTLPPRLPPSGEVEDRSEGVGTRAGAGAGPGADAGAAGDPTGRIRFTGERGQFVAEPTSDGAWAIEIHAVVGRDEMLRLQSRAFDLLFP